MLWCPCFSVFYCKLLCIVLLGPRCFSKKKNPKKIEEEINKGLTESLIGTERVKDIKLHNVTSINDTVIPVIKYEILI